MIVTSLYSTDCRLKENGSSEGARSLTIPHRRHDLEDLEGDMEAVVDEHGQCEGNGGDGEQALEDGVHDHAVGVAQQPARPPKQVVGALRFTGQLSAEVMELQAVDDTRAGTGFTVRNAQYAKHSFSRLFVH
jgi:hypothetical protein